MVLNLVAGNFVKSFPREVTKFHLPAMFTPIRTFGRPSAVLLVTVTINLVCAGVNFVVNTVSGLECNGMGRTVKSRVY